MAKAKKDIPWGMISVVGTGLWLLYDYMQKQSPAAPAFTYSNPQTGTSVNVALPTTPPVVPASTAMTPAATTAMPNIAGMTSQAIRALAAQMTTLGMGPIGQQLTAYADQMDTQGVANAPAASI